MPHLDPILATFGALSSAGAGSLCTRRRNAPREASRPCLRCGHAPTAAILSDTDPQNGVDFDIDGGASQFLSEHWHVGLVGYFTSRSRATAGPARCSVGIGPQVGYFFEFWERTWYVNVQAYYEFAAKNRPDGWNVWLSLLIPLSPAKK